MSASEDDKIKAVAWLNVTAKNEPVDVTIYRTEAEYHFKDTGEEFVDLCRVDEVVEIINTKNNEIDELKEQNKSLLEALKGIVKSSKKVIITDADKEAFLVLESAIIAAKKAIKEGK